MLWLPLRWTWDSWLKFACWDIFFTQMKTLLSCFSSLCQIIGNLSIQSLPLTVLFCTHGLEGLLVHRDKDNHLSLSFCNKEIRVFKKDLEILTIYLWNEVHRAWLHRQCECETSLRSQMLCIPWFSALLLYLMILSAPLMTPSPTPVEISCSLDRKSVV